MKWLVLGLALTGCSTDTFTEPDATPADGSASDAAGDEGPRPEGGGGDACSSASACPPNALCNTFDDGQQTLTPFVNFSQNGGTVTFESDLAVTCPSALALLAPASSSTGNPPRGGIGGTATLNVPSAVAHARVELDAILPKNPTGAATFLFLYPNSDTQNGIGLVWSGGNWFVHDAVTNDDVGVTPRTDTWNHLTLDVTFSESGGTGSVSFTYTDASGQQQIAKLSKSTLATTITSSITFGAGVALIGATSAPMVMRVDDVAFSPF